ncbi:hypothetical protein L226DRAFT_112071 [Lentinus tigrinus ALCF2SS1-7]|uniref:Uncharacterized protein n=1 Tax=Lentinus tigrinus ALCF2SS1-6 TaxID=1328759 RepID=A0A5C2S303_9APHY|nr:hypothetical protein L227DRAFT_234532 [Lentinus tigrinus ALCF2SS1-6]RPD73106.1 hypothetical protein L226DRAFT_112071 [Lentinus tigrinus ALCF2SS1-7]
MGRESRPSTDIAAVDHLLNHVARLAAPPPCNTLQPGICMGMSAVLYMDVNCVRLGPEDMNMRYSLPVYLPAYLVDLPIILLTLPVPT